MENSRVNKYRELRDGLKDEAGINHETENKINIDSNEEDDFLVSINRLSSRNTTHSSGDNLIDTMSFDDLNQKDNEQVENALRKAKESVGKKTQYNTRLDILNKIREPEKQVVRLDNFNNVNTSEFAKGFFVNKDEEFEDEVEEVVEEKPKMTLMERLASMSPEEDVKKAKMALEQEEFEEVDQEVDEPTIEQTSSLEDMLRQIKEKDQRVVEKALKEKEATKENKITEEINEPKKVIKSEKKKNDQVTTILNYVIIILVIIFLGLCGMIGYQLFF